MGLVGLVGFQKRRWIVGAVAWWLVSVRNSPAPEAGNMAWRLGRATSGPTLPPPSSVAATAAAIGVSESPVRSRRSSRWPRRLADTLPRWIRYRKGIPLSGRKHEAPHPRPPSRSRSVPVLCMQGRAPLSVVGTFLGLFWARFDLGTLFLFSKII